jgi:hypothetical protein
VPPTIQRRIMRKRASTFGTASHGSMITARCGPCRELQPCNAIDLPCLVDP